MTSVLAVLWLATSALTLAGRLLFERRRRTVRQTHAVLAASFDPQHAASRHTAAVELLERAPTSLLWALAADASLPSIAQPAVARALSRAVGLRKLREIGRRGSTWRRAAALRALVLTDPSPSWSALAEALHDPSPQVGGGVITLLGQVEHRCAAELLGDALRAGRHSRSRIATALENFPLETPDVLMPLLWSDDAHVRFWAATLMRRYPSQAGLFERLEALTDDRSPLVRKAALGTLSELDEARGVEVVERCLGDDVFFVRVHAVRALGVLGGPKSAGTIGRMLADRNWWVRTAAKQTLQSLGPEGAPSILPFLVHADLFARNGAAEVLQNTGVYERFLLEEATGRTDRYRRDVLLLLADAGGRRMWNGQMAKLAAIVNVRTRVSPDVPAHARL